MSPSNGGGARTAQASSIVAKRSESCSHPPSTSAIPCSGRSAASWSTTLPPHDWPATTGALQPRSSHTDGEVVGGGQGGIRLDVGHLGGEAVAAQVDRHDGVPDEVARHQVPQPGVGRQPVHEEDRSTVAGERAGRETRADRDHLHERQPMAARPKPPGRMGP